MPHQANIIQNIILGNIERQKELNFMLKCFNLIIYSSSNLLL